MIFVVVGINKANIRCDITADGKPLSSTPDMDHTSPRLGPIEEHTQ